MTPDFAADEMALREFLALFENGQLPREQWTHAAHIAAGAAFTLRHGEHVLAPMRAAIQRHNASVGTPPEAYHETLTVFWLAVLAEELRALGPRDELVAVRHTVAQFGKERRYYERFYSFDVVKSPEARRVWVAPDRDELKIILLLTSS